MNQSANPNRNIVVVLVVALTLLIVIAFVSLASTDRFARSTKTVNRAEHIRELIASLQGTLADAETGERGYLLSGERRNLEPYNNALPRVDPLLRELRRVLADDANDAVQRRRLDGLAPLVATRLELLKASIALRETQGADAAVRALRSGAEGKQIMDEIRWQLAVMDAHERAESSTQHAAAQANARRTRNILWSSIGIAVAISGITLLLLRRTAAERSRAFQKIREQAALLDKAEDAISVCDLDHRLVYWNRAYAALFGQPPPGGRHLLSGDGPEARAVWSTAGEAVRQSGEWSGEFEFLSGARGRVFVQSRWTLIRDDAGNPRSVLMVDTDVTDRKAIEARYLRAQRLESIGLLASGIAHDLNNVLAPLVMGLPLLQTRISSPPDRHLLSIMEASVRRGTAVVRQVLGFAQGVSERRGAIQIGHVVREVADVAGETFPKTIRFEAQRPKNLPLVLADPNQIHQVLLNLCINARDAMPDGGELTLSLDTVEVPETVTRLHPGTKPGRHVRLGVRDTGAGIAPELREKIFDPFFTTKGPGRGTGLGLPTVVEIVRNHGGFVELQTEVGKGSTFSVFLPAVAETEAEAGQHRQAELPRGGGEAVLVVDDEAAVRELTKAMLEAHGYIVFTAADGAEAVAIFAAQQTVVRLVLTDLDMPVMSGRATIAALRRIQPKIRIVAMTGTLNDETREGVFATLNKPVTKQDLLVTVHDALS